VMMTMMMTMIVGMIANDAMSRLFMHDGTNNLLLVSTAQRCSLLTVQYCSDQGTSCKGLRYFFPTC